MRSNFPALAAAVVLTLWPALGWATSRVQTATGAPAEVSPAVAEVLAPQHLRLEDEDGRPLYEFWITQVWKSGGQPGQPGDFAPIEYRLLPGGLVGVLTVHVASLDVRDQPIVPGTYTLRYAVQPDLDTHRDSHDSRDFLLLVPAADDMAPDPIEDPKLLMERSTAVTLSTHPAILPLVKPVDLERATPLRPDDKNPDGEILLLSGHDEQGAAWPLELIVLRPDPAAAP